MKKIALLLIVAMLLSAIFAAIPASAAEAEKAAINFTALDYMNRDWKSHKAYTQEEFDALITTETKANSLSTHATDANAPNNDDSKEDNYATAYFSKMFPITEQTDVTLYVNAKNHRVGGYCGLIFAADAEDHPYFIYGALANGSDDDEKNCELRARYRYHNNESSIGSQLSGTNFNVTQELVDGFGQYKIVYKGLTVTVYTKTADGWVQVTFGDMKNFTLKEGSYISLGIYSRHGHGNRERTATIINPTIEATAADLKAMLNPILKDCVAKASALAPAAYTQESYNAVVAAASKAGSLADDAAVADIEKAIADVAAALEGLVFAKYNVSFDANGGTGTMDPVADVNGGAYKLPECAFTAPEGMLFKGWATAADGEVIDGDATLVADTTFYAIWTPFTYTVSFQRNGGSGKMFDVEGVLGEYTLPECTFTAPTGKVFKGWSIEKNGEVVGDTYNVTGETTFYAVWGDPDYTVEFNSNGGSGEMPNVEISGELTLPECTFTAPAGKVFKGWSVSKDNVSIVDKIVVTGDVIVFAIWEDDSSATETPAKPTETPAGDDKPTEEPAAQGGCGGSIAIGATVVVAVLGTAIVLKKKEN